jgi:hypothetical protein
MKLSSCAPNFLNVFVAFAVVVLLVRLAMKMNAKLRTELTPFYVDNVNTMLYFDTLYVATILLLTSVVCKQVKLPFLVVAALVTLVVDLVWPFLVKGSDNRISTLLKQWSATLGNKGYVYDIVLVLLTVGVMNVLKGIKKTTELHTVAVPVLMLLNLYL